MTLAYGCKIIFFSLCDNKSGSGYHPICIPCTTTTCTNEQMRKGSDHAQFILPNDQVALRGQVYKIQDAIKPIILAIQIHCLGYP